MAPPLLFVKKTPIVGEFCTNLQRASSSFTESKLRTHPFVWHKIPSTIVVYFGGEIGEIGEIFNPQFSILNSK